LISPEAKNRVCELVQSGINEGAQILLDGRDIKVKGYEKGNFVGPTVLHYVKVIKVNFKFIIIIKLTFHTIIIHSLVE
jgi:acyl-CoA reductase-like NAD-dependent aldehyde dehydrogenase